MKRIDIHARGITRHTGRTKRVNARLDDDVRKGEERILKTYRKAELQDLCQRLLMDAELEDEDPAEDTGSPDRSSQRSCPSTREKFSRTRSR